MNKGVHRDVALGLFFLWLWYYGQYPKVHQLWEISVPAASMLDDIIVEYERGDLVVSSYEMLDRQIDVVLSLYPISRKMIEMVILRGDRATSSKQKKLSAVNV